jgi:gamma-glutamylcyclotransferase (GGCT)/AIG2-like uncharacterized protein YtfP
VTSKTKAKPIYYFAYGSNLNKEQMKRRCPRAVAMGGLELPQAQLVFNGVADVVFHETKTAVGGLWRITDECEASLDGYEGVGFKGADGKPRAGAYRKETIKVIVTTKGVESVEDALIYVMNRNTRKMPLVSYLNIIKQGFDDFGLDQTFLNRALLDTRGEAAAQATRETEERKARWAQEDAERARRVPHERLGSSEGDGQYFHTLQSWNEAKLHEKRKQYGMPEYRKSQDSGITDLFDDAEREAMGEYYDCFDDDIAKPREIPRRQSLTVVKKTHDKSAKGSIIPANKSVHLFNEPYYPKPKQKVK